MGKAVKMYTHNLRKKNQHCSTENVQVFTTKGITLACVHNECIHSTCSYNLGIARMSSPEIFILSKFTRLHC